MGSQLLFIHVGGVRGSRVSDWDGPGVEHAAEQRTGIAPASV